MSNNPNFCVLNLNIMSLLLIAVHVGMWVSVVNCFLMKESVIHGSFQLRFLMCVLICVKHLNRLEDVHSSKGEKQRRRGGGGGFGYSKPQMGHKAKLYKQIGSKPSRRNQKGRQFSR